MRWLISAALAAGFILAGFAMAGTASAAPPPKFTVCHAAGLAGTTHFIELELSLQGYSTHIDPITGTPQAGHEDDFAGECAGGPPEECPPGTTGTFPDCVPIECPPGTTGTPPNCVAPPGFCEQFPTDPICLPPGETPGGGNGGTPGEGPRIFGGQIVTGPFPNPGGIFVPPPVAQVAGVQQVLPAALPAAGFGPGDGSSFGWLPAALAVSLLGIGGMTALMARRQKS